MKLSILVLASVSIAWCSALENGKPDDVHQHRNHKTSSRNDTQHPLAFKQARAYPAQVNEITTVTPAEQSKTITAESPTDAIRLFITPAAGKRKQDAQQPAAVATTQYTAGPFPMLKTTVNWVTAKSVTAATSTQKDKKSPFYPAVASSTSNVKIISDFRPTVIAADNDSKYYYNNNKPTSDGTAKIKNAPKTQSQMPSNYIYATTTTGFPPVGGNAWNSTSYVITTKVSSVNASKPFTTVLVPKQMLDGNPVQRGNVRDDSFRPIASPVFSYKPTVDTNSVENRRLSNVGQTSMTNAPKSTKHESAKQSSAAGSSYKVQEEYPVHDDFSVDVYDSRSYSANNNNNNNNRRDRIDQIYVPPISADRLETEKPINYQTKYDPSKQPQTVQHNTPKLEIKYGFAVPESFKYEKKTFENAQPPITDQFREFYPATEVSSIKDIKSHPLYNSAGKFEMRPAPNEMTGLSFELEKPSAAAPHKDFSSYLKYSTSTAKESNGYGQRHKGFSSSSYDWPPSKKYETDYSYTDKPVDDVDAKDVLKSLLLDMLKSKQQSEIKPKSSPGMHEIIDAYFKTNRPNVDLSLDNYNIETGKFWRD